MALSSSASRNDLDVDAYTKDGLDILLAGGTNDASRRPDVWAKSDPESVGAKRVASAALVAPERDASGGCRTRPANPRRSPHRPVKPHKQLPPDVIVAQSQHATARLGAADEPRMDRMEFDAHAWGSQSRIPRPTAAKPRRVGAESLGGSIADALRPSAEKKHSGDT